MNSFWLRRTGGRDFREKERGDAGFRTVKVKGQVAGRRQRGATPPPRFSGKLQDFQDADGGSANPESDQF